MSEIIFDELDRHKTRRYKVRGCEKVLVVRSLNTTINFTLEIDTKSLKDPHYRINHLMTITNPGNYDLSNLSIACGMELTFTILEPFDPSHHLFVEILYETCVPEKCCICPKD